MTEFEDLFHVSFEAAKLHFGQETASRLHKAWRDFSAVVRGQKPEHALMDTGKPRPADGGTSYYQGDGYQLTIVMSLNGIMHADNYISGYIYGPIVSFEEKVMKGNFPRIQNLSFYLEADLRRFISHE